MWLPLAPGRRPRTKRRVGRFAPRTSLGPHASNHASRPDVLYLMRRVRKCAPAVRFGRVASSGSFQRPGFGWVHREKSGVHVMFTSCSCLPFWESARRGWRLCQRPCAKFRTANAILFTNSLPDPGNYQGFEASPRFWSNWSVWFASVASAVKTKKPIRIQATNGCFRALDVRC